MRTISKSLLIIFCWLWVSPLYAQDDICTLVGSTYDVETKQCVQQRTIDVTISYPSELTENSFVIETITRYLDAERSLFLDFADDAETVFFFGPPLWTFHANIETYQHSDDILTVRVWIDQYLGGAHPFDYIRTFTFDLRGNQLLAFEDLFQPDVNPIDLVKPAIVAAHGEDIFEFLNSIDDVTDNLETYQFFALTDEALLIFLPPFRSGPIHAAAFETVIPLAKLDGSLDEAIFGGE